MNDNKNDNELDKVVPFRKKKIKEDDGQIFASVFLRKGMIGVEIKEETVLLNTRMAFELAFILLTAIRVKADMPFK